MMIINMLVAVAAVVGIAWGIHAQHREMQRLRQRIEVAQALIMDLVEVERRKERAERSRVEEFLS